MLDRDFDYIETRLLAPAMGASEAYERLRLLRQPLLAERLMAAQQTFQDECRAVRSALRDVYAAS